MKRHCLLLTVLALAASGCSDDSALSTVKNGVLDIDKSTTIGKAFDGYKYFTDVTWRSFETQNGRAIVEVSALIDFAKITPQDVAEAEAAAAGIGPPSQAAENPRIKNALSKVRETSRGAELITQFQLNQDKSLEVHAMVFRFVLVKEPTSPENPLNDELIAATLQEIYQERLSSLVLGPILSAQ